LLHAGPTQSGGDAKVWFTQSHGMGFGDMAALVAAHPRSRHTPLFLPHLQGERAPLWDADLRGAFLGISRQSQQPDFARAVYEGVAMAARLSLETLQTSAGVISDSIACGGGGFRSDPWNQIRADVLGVELRLLAAGEPGLVGAATMAAVGLGHYAHFDDAFGALGRFSHGYTPDPRMRGLYEDLFGLYGPAISANADLGKRLARLTDPQQMAPD